MCSVISVDNLLGLLEFKLCCSATICSKIFHSKDDCIFYTDNGYIYASRCKVIQEGEILRVLVNKDSEGQSNIEITIPSNARTENHENTQNRIFNHNSDLELGNQACFTKKDYPNLKLQRYLPRLDNTYIDKGNDYSNEDHSDENKNRLRLERKIDLGKETLIMFRLKGMLYSPSALMHLDMEDIEITNSIDILCISETESELRVEVLTGLNRYTAFEFVKLLQFLHNGQRVRKLKDLIPCLKLGM
ncbi:unnamed protein product [Mytilus coruscus]|uniref:Uncharacterized protein n=1 Tax=Mytilus coruscus TaxID=42192 RepID=A0A6J8D393_MYTCO|nr:unnamed protein product [Mytilus coruscus]